MSLIKKGPSTKKKLTLTFVLVGALLLTGLVLYFGIFKQDTPPEALPLGVQSDAQKQASTQAVALSGTIKEMLEFFNTSPQWHVLHLASGLGTTTASSLGRGDPFAVIPGYENDSPTSNK